MKRLQVVIIALIIEGLRALGRGFLRAGESLAKKGSYPADKCFYDHPAASVLDGALFAPKENAKPLVGAALAASGEGFTREWLREIEALVANQRLALQTYSRQSPPAMVD